MAYNLDAFSTEAKEVVSWLSREFGTIRTGRATPSLLDAVQVESYGANMSLQQVGSIVVEDARTIRIVPWDSSQTKAVEKAITEANLGLSVVTDDRGLRVIFPELTSERREQLLKLAKSKLEDARISVRKARDEAMKGIDRAVKEGMGEDESFRTKAELQKRVDAVNVELESAFAKKEAELKL